MNLYVVLYHHKHGQDSFLVPAESEGEAVKSMRAELVEQYSEEEIAREEADYGDLEAVERISEGRSFGYAGVRYRMRFEKVAKRIKDITYEEFTEALAEIEVIEKCLEEPDASEDQDA